MEASEHHVSFHNCVLRLHSGSVDNKDNNRTFSYDRRAICSRLGQFSATSWSLSECTRFEGRKETQRNHNPLNKSLLFLVLELKLCISSSSSWESTEKTPSDRIPGSASPLFVFQVNPSNTDLNQYTKKKKAKQYSTNIVQRVVCEGSDRVFENTVFNKYFLLCALRIKDKSEQMIHLPQDSPSQHTWKEQDNRKVGGDTVFCTDRASCSHFSTCLALPLPSAAHFIIWWCSPACPGALPALPYSLSCAFAPLVAVHGRTFPFLCSTCPHLQPSNLFSNPTSFTFFSTSGGWFQAISPLALSQSLLKRIRTYMTLLLYNNVSHIISLPFLRT